MDSKTKDKMEDKTVLVVDDILHNRLLLVNIIKNIGCKVVEARHGREAIEIMLKSKIDLIFMDIEMPIMNGFETTEYIRKKMKYPHKYTPIVAVTAAISPQAMGDYQARGFDDVFYKPVNVNQIVGLLEDKMIKTEP